MNTKLTSTAVIAASLLLAACNTPEQDDAMFESGGLFEGGTDGDVESDSESDTAQGESESDTAESDGDSAGSGFPDTGDGNDSDGSIPTCGGDHISLTSLPPNVVLLLDKSGSMTDNAWDHDGSDDTAPVNRWTSLHDVTSDLLGEYGDRMNVGAVLFPSLDSSVPDSNNYDTVFDAACKMSDDVEVAVAADNRQTILEALPGRTERFEGATPTRQAVLNGLEHLENLDAQGPRAMVLVTDGAANCVYDPDTNIGRVYDTDLELAVSSAYEDHGIPTYVVGIDIDADHPVQGRNLTDDLNAVAVAGGVAREGAENFYNVADQTTLAAALDAIAARVECTIDLETVPTDPEYVDVSLNGEDLAQVESCDEGDGWRFASADHTSIELCNASCQSFQEVRQLDTTYNCPPAG